MTSSLINKDDAYRFSRGLPHVVWRKNDGGEMTFYFLRCKWQINTNSGGDWMLRMLSPEALPWVMLTREGRTAYPENLVFPGHHIIIAYRVAKENILALRYFPKTPIFDERHKNYRSLLVSMDESSVGTPASSTITIPETVGAN